MATVAHHIRSSYDADEERDGLLQQTGQIPNTHPQELHQPNTDPDPWQTESESSFGSNRLTSAPSFIPATLSYEEVNEAIGSALSNKEPFQQPRDQEKRSEISGWYKSLNRQEGSRASSSSPSPCSSGGTSTGADPPTRAAQPVSPPTRRRTERDWFISNALQSTHPSTTTTSHTPIAPRSPRTLADILDRDPPSHQSHIPPTWITLGPNNRGYAMLQNSGWSEGQPLGCFITRRNGHVPPSPKQATGQKAGQEVKFEEEVQCEGFDDVIELKTETRQVIDLTISDDSSDSEEVRDYEQPPPATAGSTSLDHGGKALLTPIPTVLKSDRLGIGLKARTYGPYKASRKRVTHNAAALAAHVKSHQDMRKLKAKIGRGSRGFAKLSQREAANRKDLLAYLNS